MRRLIIGLLAILPFIGTAQAHRLAGRWVGNLSTPMGKLRLVLHVEVSEKTIIKMDSPYQGAYGIPTDSALVEETCLSFDISQLMLTYRGCLDSEQRLSGTLIQGGMMLPLHFERQDSIAPSLIVPHSRDTEVVFTSHGDSTVRLAGTLARPLAGVHDRGIALVLISGSGKHDRDELIVGHRPFAVLSDSLARYGYTTLRYDKRGAGASGGSFETATLDDFALDAMGAVHFARMQGFDRVVLAGHSEGGLVAALVAKQWPREVSAILLLNAPIKPGKIVLLEQTDTLARASGITGQALERNRHINRELYHLSADPNVSNEQLKARAKELLTPLLLTTATEAQRKQMLDATLAGMTLPSTRGLIQSQPLEELRQVRCPILAVQSGMDMQVLPSNADVLEEAIPTARIRRVPATNHLMQPCDDGHPMHYASISTTLAPTAWRAILELLSTLH